jgi:serine/threonine-protein kinase RIO1
MQLTPDLIRTDLKCGKGAISKGEKCHKGPATTAAVAAGAVGLAVGAGVVLSASRKRRANTSIKAPSAGMEFKSKGTQGEVWVSKDNRIVTKTARTAKGSKALIEEARTQQKAHKAGVNTPKVIEINSKSGSFSMENLEGFEQLSSPTNNRSNSDNKNYAKDIVINLSKAHAKDIAHGDLRSNVLVKGGKLSIIDWGQSSTVSRKGITDVLNAIRFADELDPGLARTMKAEFKPIQAKFTKNQTLTVSDFNQFYQRVLSSTSRADQFCNTLTSVSVRTDLKCGKGAISPGEKCHKGPASKANSKKNTLASKVAIAAGAAVAVGGIAYGTKKFHRAQSTNKGLNAPGPDGRRAEPNVVGSRAKTVFQEMRGVSLGTQIAGAGMSLAGAGLYAYGRQSNNAGASMAGLGLALLGGQTVVGGERVRNAISEQERKFNNEHENYSRQYYSARNAAKNRQANAGAHHTNSRTSANKAVKDPFKDLGVSPEVSDTELKSTWLKLMRENHPDAGGDPRRATQINAAYQEILRRRGRRDSIWAEGFTVDWSAV